jgi:hypothetical protein
MACLHALPLRLYTLGLTQVLVVRETIFYPTSLLHKTRPSSQGDPWQIVMVCSSLSTIHFGDDSDTRTPAHYFGCGVVTD